jgi:hypothetical protein
MYYVALLCDAAVWLRNGAVAAQGGALAVVREYESFLRGKERARVEPGFETPRPAATDGRKPARLTEVFVHDGSGFPRGEFAAGETLAVDVAFETEDTSLAFHVRVGVDRDDGMQAFAVDTRDAEWAPVSGRRRYRLRLVLPELPLAQGDFAVYAYLGDEKALHVHDVRILKPGFTVASPEYVVGVVAPRHHWTMSEDDAASEALPAAGGVAASS